MKAFVKLMTLVMLISMVVSCAPATPVATEPPATEPPATEPAVVPTAAPTEIPLTASEQWAKDYGLGPYQPEVDDWAAIEAAAKLEGSVCVYANSSKVNKLFDTWAELYPEITLDCGDTDYIDVKMREEQIAGNVVGDVWFNSDGHILMGEFMPNEWMWWFVPRDVVQPEVTAEQPFAIARHAIDVWGYNVEVHPDGCPLTNWWQLTDPSLAGKVFIDDPMTDVSTMAKWATVAEHSDEMAAAYQELYGADWTTDPASQPDAFGQEVLNAGWLWIKKMAQNQPVVVDEVDLAYASVGMDLTVEPGYGWTGWTSVDDTAAGDIAMGACLDMAPSLGIMKTSYLGIANNAPHPNAAKLFIKFALTPAGFKPWNKVGSYSGIFGMEDSDAEAVMPLSEVLAKHAWLMNPLYDWEWAAKVRDFWAVSLLTAP
jgi:iron(III) transport system substrate-binding protein